MTRWNDWPDLGQRLARLAATAPYAVCVGNGYGLPRGYVSELSRHSTLENALAWARVSGQQGRVFIRAAGEK